MSKRKARIQTYHLMSVHSRRKLRSGSWRIRLRSPFGDELVIEARTDMSEHFEMGKTYTIERKFHRRHHEDRG